MKKKIGLLILVQLSVMIYTLSGIVGKFASAYDVMSIPFIGLYCLEVFILGIYAILWQQLISRMELTIAYANKSSTLIWSLLWSIIIFHENITIQNIVGIIIVMAGIILINTDSANDSKDNTLEGDSL